MRLEREAREGLNGPLRDRVGSASCVTRPSSQVTPTQLQCGVDRFHWERICGFLSEFLNERRDFVSGFCSFWLVMVKSNRLSTKRVKI